MPWWGWLTLAGYLLGAINTWRKVFYALATEFGRVDWDDLVMAAMAGGLGACIWPIVEAYYLLRATSAAKGWKARDVAERLGKMSREDRQKAKERDLREREARIRRMEDELGIKRDEPASSSGWSPPRWASDLLGGR